MYAQAAAAPPPAASSSLPPTASATINSSRGPFPTMTRKHGVRSLLVPASPHVETYVRALVRVVGPSAIVAASKIAALLPALSTLGKPVSVISPLPLGCKDPTLRHIFSFRRQVQLLLLSAARGGEALEGSFLVPHQGALYRVYFSTGEARCYLCQASGHVRRDCPLARQGEAPGIPETQQDIGPIIADTPGCPVPKPVPPSSSDHPFSRSGPRGTSPTTPRRAGEPHPRC
ncbi:unnamed protein product [Natator depressus]